MRKCGFILAVLAVGGLSAVAVELCEYRAPITSLTSAWLSGTYRYFDQPGTPEVDVNAGRASLTLDRIYDSPSFGYSVSGMGDVGFVGLALRSLAAQAAATARYYFTEGQPLFGFGGLEASHALGQPNPGLRASAGVGYGRFSDVTPLAQALLIQNGLLERNAIPKKLPDEVLLAIAQEIGRKVEYAEAKDLVAAVVGLIEGATGTELDARSVLFVEDEILTPAVQRYCGWSLEGGVGYELMDPYGGARDIGLTASANVAYATSPGSQFLFQAHAAGPIDIMNEHELRASLSYEDILSATSFFQGSLALQRIKPKEEEPRDSLSGTLQFSFALGKANVGVRYSFTKGPADPGFSFDLSLSLSMKII